MQGAALDGVLDGVLSQLLALIALMYSHQWFPPFVLMPIMLVWAWYIQRRETRKTLPFIRAATERSDALEAAIGGDSDPEGDRQKFAEGYFGISSVMNASSEGAKPLIEAWKEFSETCIFDDEKVVQNTARPSTFFMRVVPRQASLTFSSNIFVGAGLILTFIGLIIALNTAAESMGADTAGAQGALKELLRVAGAKFFTSVAGIGASIWLRFAEHGLTRKSTAPVARICELLERGMLYVSPQKLASDQLTVMREQRDQLRTFNTDFALQLSEKIGVEFRNAIGPVAQSLDSLNDNMTSVTQGIGAGAAKAIQDVSGEQLRGLSETLAGLRDKLDGITSKVDASGTDAAAQIKAAGEQFAQAALGIQAAFDTLTGNVDSLGQTLTKKGEEAAKTQDEALARMLAGLESSQKQIAEIMVGAVGALEAAGKKAAADIEANSGQAIGDAVKRNQDLLKVAMEESSKGLRDAVDELADAIADAATDINDAGVKFERSAEGATQTANSLGQITASANQVSTALRSAATEVADAASPMVQAARNTAETAAKIASSIDAYSSAQSRALGEMRELAEGVKQTQSAAEGAWRDYRGRFEGVDQMLGKTMDTMATQLSACLTDFRRFAQDTDRALAEAVSKMNGLIEPIAEYGESLDEFVDEMRKGRGA